MLPVEDSEEPLSDDHAPLMLLALNSTDAIDWEELQAKVKSIKLYRMQIHKCLVQGDQLAKHLAKPLSRFREHLAVVKSPSAVASPDRPTH